MPAALALLLLTQEHPDADTTRRLDALFALPSLATARPAYRRAKAEEDFTLTVWEGLRGVGFGKGSALDGRAYHVDLDAQGRLRSFSSEIPIGDRPRNDPDEPAPEVISAASGIVRELIGEDRELDLDFAMIDENGVRSISFRTYRRVENRPVIERGSAIGIIVGKEVRLRSFGRAPHDEEIDAETYGHNRALPSDRLRTTARDRLRAAKIRLGLGFAQYRLETDRVEIALPDGRDPGNVALAQRRIGIPIYRRTEFAPSEPGGDATIEVSLDARTGTVLDLWVGRGRMGSGGAISLPNPLTFAGVTGRLEPLAMRSATPPGRPVDLPVGRDVFAARFEPGQGTLWISPGGRELYRAYHPDPGLRRALTSGIERSRILAKAR